MTIKPLPKNELDSLLAEFDSILKSPSLDSRSPSELQSLYTENTDLLAKIEIKRALKSIEGELLEVIEEAKLLTSNQTIKWHQLEVISHEEPVKNDEILAINKYLSFSLQRIARNQTENEFIKRAKAEIYSKFNEQTEILESQNDNIQYLLEKKKVA